MHSSQPGILADLPNLARFVTFAVDPAGDVVAALTALRAEAGFGFGDGRTVIGIGASLAGHLQREVPGLRTFTAQSAHGIDVPSTPAALWCWLRGDDRGELFHRSRQLELLLAPGFQLVEVVDSFTFDRNRDLGGYEDGTENPEGEEAIAAAVVQGAGEGMDGSSFVAVQQWLHDFDSFEEMNESARDDVIGRHVADNEEFDEAPESAHVKRTAQESYEPEAFIVRRSMPWADEMEAGLMFIAFGKSFDAFEAILNRMLGHEDAITDALFTFTHPISGAYYWCPPLKDGRLDLSRVGL